MDTKGGIFMKRIKDLRVARSLTQEDLGKVLNVQKAAISKYEKGRAEPSVDILKRMARYFGVSSDYLLELSDIAQPPAVPAATPSLTPQDRELLHKYHTLTPDHQQDIDHQLDFLYDKDRPKIEDTAT